MYALITILSIPGFPFAAAAGVAFMEAYDRATGKVVLIGGVAVWAGANIGSDIALMLARYLFRKQAKKCSKKYALFRAIDQAMDTNGLKFTMLLRLCPMIPYNSYNYVLGITSVTFRDFALGNLFMLPGSMFYVYVGTSISNVSDAVSGEYEYGPEFIAFLVVGTFSSCAVGVYITCVVRHKLK